MKQRLNFNSFMGHIVILVRVKRLYDETFNLRGGKSFLGLDRSFQKDKRVYEFLLRGNLNLSAWISLREIDLGNRKGTFSMVTRDSASIERKNYPKNRKWLWILRGTLETRNDLSTNKLRSIIPRIDRSRKTGLMIRRTFMRYLFLRNRLSSS